MRHPAIYEVWKGSMSFFLRRTHECIAMRRCGRESRESFNLSFPTNATRRVTRPLPLFSYATTVGIHSSLLLFTALFLPRTSLAVFGDTSNFPFLQPLDRPQPEFLEALTASPSLTLAWLCAGVFVISLSWAGRIRSQAYEQRRPVDKTDFEVKKEV